MKSYINRHYFIKYKNFIQSRNNRHLEQSSYNENHHIIPVSINSNYPKTILLTAREHYIAHKILSKVFIKNTKYWFSMAKAFNFMCIGQKNKRYINSYDYQYRKELHSNAMKFNNPMFSDKTRKKMSISSKKSWTEERKNKQSIKMTGVPLNKSTKEKLSKFWTGKRRPKSQQHIENNKKANSCGLFKTPFGIYTSASEAANSPENIKKISRYLINKFCKDKLNGKFDYVPNGKTVQTGRWKRKVASS